MIEMDANPDEMSEIRVSRSNDMTMYTDKSKLHWIWLPRQDQLQGMLSASVTIGYMVCELNEFYDPESQCVYGNPPCRSCRNLGIRRRATYDTMSQWWLAFVMFEKFRKWWSIEKSEWIECDDDEL
jgi:hypothetical protein